MGPAGSHRLIENQLFPEYHHVAYQINGNEAYNNMLAKSLLLHLPLTPGVVLKGYKVGKVVMMHNQII